jgi:Peptidase family C25/SdrD B-like domain
MKTQLSILGIILCASATFGASLNVWTNTLDSSLFPTDAGDASTVTFIESGLSVSTTEGQDFLVLCSFTTGNNGTDNNRQGRWQLATDYTGSDYTYTTASSSVNGSAIYERWINGKESSGVNEYGSVNMSGIYNFGLDTTHTFKLYHRTNAGADIRTQDGTLVVVGLNVAGTTLRHGSATQDTTITPTGPTPYESVTTNTNWSAVEKSSGSDLGAAIDVSEYGGEVFVAASMNCSATGSDSLTIYGEWQLVLYDSATNVVERLGTSIQRQVLNRNNEKGAAMLYAVTSDLTNGTYTVKLEQKVDATSAAAGRGIETFNASINAVGLTLQDGSDAGDRFESFSVGDETTSTNATRVYDRAVEEESISLRVDQGLVLAAHFTTSGDTNQTGDVLASLYEEKGSVARYDSEETLRTVGGSGSKGAGGVIGYSERTAGLYDAALNFRSDAHTYYLSRATLAGFATEAVGDPMVYGDLAWFDTDGNGVVDVGENTPITNVTVELVDSATNVLAVTITDTNGFYQFSYDVPPGSRIRFDLTTVPTNVTVSSTHMTGDTGAYVYTTVLTNAPGTTNVSYTLGITYAGATRAEVADVWGEWSGDAGRVVWRTSSEWGVAGFWIYRVDPKTGAKTKLNEQLIPAAFYEGGARYEWVDVSAQEGASGSYRLEEVELTGAVRDLGVQDVVFLPPLPVKTPRVVREVAPSVLATPKTVATSSLLKVTFEKDGLYGIGVQAIADGMGESLETVHAWMDSGMLSFRSEGESLRYHVEEARERVVLFASAADNWYTRDSVIMISHDKGTQMARRDPAAEGVEEWIFDVTLRFEEDRYPFDSAQSRPEDFYYWDYVISGNATLGERTYALDLSGYDGGDATVKVRLMGWSSTANNPDHQAEFSLNGTVQGSVTFDGQEEVEAVLTIPEADVLSGINTLTVKGVLQRGVAFSYFVVDRMDVTFERELVPEAPFALFQGGWAGEVIAEPFTEPLAVVLPPDSPPLWIADENGELPSRSWGIGTPEEWFAVIEAESLPMLVPEPVADDVWFLSETNQIDYLVVTSRELATAAQELADYRSSQGLRVGVVLFEDVCDWFMDGLRTPEAITELLYYAETVWAEAPWMMVLAGNGHYDYLGALDNEVNHLPPLLVQTLDGLFSSDGELSDLDGDTLPDVATGRLPARTAAELTLMISKIKAYEAEFGSSWQNEVVLAADAADEAGDFSAANDLLASLVDGDHSVAGRIDLDTMPITTARADLLDRFEAGAGIIQYTGHSSINQFSSQGLLTAADVNVMTSTRPPIVLALCCLAGRYEAPGVDCMGELLMRSEGGAVAVWAASGLPLLNPSTELGTAFYQNVFQDEFGTLGRATQAARRSLEGDIFTQGTYTVYNLLGDPALRMAGNIGESECNANFAQWRWQHFSPVTLADPDGMTVEDEFFDYSMGSDSVVVAELPEFGFPLAQEKTAGEEAGFILRWRRRVQHGDVEYQLVTSEELEQWEAESPDLEEVGVEPDPDGIMETVRTWVKSPPGGSQVFIGIQATRK